MDCAPTDSTRRRAASEAGAPVKDTSAAGIAREIRRSWSSVEQHAAALTKAVQASILEHVVTHVSCIACQGQ